MFPRAFFAICALVLLATVTIRAEEPEIDQNEALDDNNVEERNPLLAIAIRVLAQAFKWAAKHCLKEAANRCKGDWKNPGNLIKCAERFLQENKGRCVTG